MSEKENLMGAGKTRCSMAAEGPEEGMERRDLRSPFLASRRVGQTGIARMVSDTGRGNSRDTNGARIPNR